MMKAQEVILKAAAVKLKWWEAAEIMQRERAAILIDDFVSYEQILGRVAHQSWINT